MTIRVDKLLQPIKPWIPQQSFFFSHQLLTAVFLHQTLPPRSDILPLLFDRFLAIPELCGLTNCSFIMDLDASNRSVSPEVGIRKSKLDSVFALLDEVRSQQLLEQVIPAVTYSGTFEIVGRDDGLDPPTQLCSPCRDLFRRPPPTYAWAFDANSKKPLDWGNPPPAEFWKSHHDTFFQLIDCCFNKHGSCRICQILWHGIRFKTLRLRSSQKTTRNITWYDDGLKIALKQGIHTKSSFDLCLNIILEPWDGFVNNFSVKVCRGRCRIFELPCYHDSFSDSA